MTKRIQISIVFIVMHLSFGYIVYPNLLYTVTKTAHWELIICQGILQLILILCYTKGLNYFPQDNVIDIYLKMGRGIAVIFLIPFVINLTFLVAYNIRLHTEVIVSIFLPRTPYWSILLLLFFLSVYTAIKGLGTILRATIFISIIAIPLVMFNVLSSVVNFDLHNITQAVEPSPYHLLNVKYIYILGFSFFLFLGFFSVDMKWRLRHLSLLCVLVVLSYLSIVYVPLFIFGQETVLTLENPFLEAMDSVNISWFVFNRQTMLFGISLIGLVTLSNSVILWVIGTIMRKVINYQKAKSSTWIITFSIMAFILALLVPDQSTVEKYFLWSIGVQTCFIIIIPFTILIYGFLLKGKKGRLEHEK